MDRLFWMLSELVRMVLRRVSIDLLHRKSMRSLLMNFSHSPRNLSSSWAFSYSWTGGKVAGGSRASRKSVLIVN